ncbi:hypothetical protein ABZP36_029375 [Zizania latifolia]
MASTRSTCTTQTVRGTHQFEVVGYSLKKGVGVGNFVPSAAFDVGGYRWAVLYYPDGLTTGNGFVSVFVQLVTDDVKVRALFDLRLVDRATGLSCSVYRRAEATVFDSKSKFMKRERGIRSFMSKADLETSTYVRDDRLTIECVLDVVQDSVVTPAAAAASREVQVPPSDLHKHLAKLLHDLQELSDDDTGDGDVVTFEVKGEAFRAHTAVLAARSPVFRAELYLPMKEKAMRRIAIADMQPLVFKVLLHFVYTDALLVMDDLGAEDYKELVHHLLEAADRYAMDRLKVICELILSRSLDANTVATTLALADLHSCKGLKDVCVHFMSSLGFQG